MGLSGRLFSKIGCFWQFGIRSVFVQSVLSRNATVLKQDGAFWFDLGRGRALIRVIIDEFRSLISNR